MKRTLKLRHGRTLFQAWREPHGLMATLSDGNSFRIFELRWRLEDLTPLYVPKEWERARG